MYYTSIVCEKNNPTTWRHHIQNDIFNNRDVRDPPTKPPTPTNVPRVKVQSNNPTIVLRVHLYFNDITRVQRVQPPAATPSPQQTLRLSKQIPNLSKPIVYHNANVTVHLSALEEQFISDMMNIKAVPDPTTGDLLKIPEAILWRDGIFNKLSRLTQGRKKRTIKGTNTIHLISPNQKPTNKKQPMRKFLSATDHKNNTHIDFRSLL